MNKPFWGGDIWKDTWGLLSESVAFLTVFHAPGSIKTLTTTGNLGADVLAQYEPSGPLSKYSRLDAWEEQPP